MELVEPLEVCCDIWHHDVSSGSFISCKLRGGEGAKDVLGTAQDFTSQIIQIRNTRLELLSIDPNRDYCLLLCYIAELIHPIFEEIWIFEIIRSERSGNNGHPETWLLLLSQDVCTIQWHCKCFAC